MKKKFFLSILGIGFWMQAQAQEIKATVDNLAVYTTKDTLDGWHTSGLVGVTFGQTSLTNWVAGGDNTVSGDFMLNLMANYLKGKWFCDNSLAVEYGLLYASSNDYWQKAADKLNLVSVGGHEISKKWSAAALLDFNTQIAKGYNYPDREHYISTGMAPGYLNLALGFTYKPDKNYTFFLSPIAERLLFVLDDSLSATGAFGIDPGKKIRFETGAYLMVSTKQTLAGNLSLISNVNFFTPYNKDFGHIDVNWDLLLSWKLNKLLTATVSTTVRYYEKEIQRVQFKEIFGLGLTYKF